MSDKLVLLLLLVGAATAVLAAEMQEDSRLYNPERWCETRIDGCSVGLDSRVVPFADQWRDVCNSHDMCYYCAASRQPSRFREDAHDIHKVCDDAFISNLYSWCQNKYKWYQYHLKRNCMNWASIYMAVVRAFPDSMVSTNSSNQKCRKYVCADRYLPYLPVQQ